MWLDRNLSPAVDLPAAGRSDPKALHPLATIDLDVGMPELCGAGLSEVWLQKACGAQHWRGIEHLVGQPSQAWRDVGGRRIYASFGWLRSLHTGLATVAEGDRLSLGSELCWRSRTQVMSRHRLGGADQDVATVEMLSVFISRHVEGDNHSVRRAEFANEPAWDSSQGSPPAKALLHRVRSWRQSAVTRSDQGERWSITPCARTDFNGAGLLYFPSFTAFADRAMESWGWLRPSHLVTSRESLFLGNVRVGETVTVLGAVVEDCDGVTQVELRFLGGHVQRPLAEMRLSLSL
jgi:probable biosynthetic protein (TIGR04099 family)